MAYIHLPVFWELAGGQVCDKKNQSVLKNVLQLWAKGLGMCSPTTR
jgi:hypothetical protein